MRFLSVILISVVLASCVSKSKYAELLEKHKRELSLMDEKLIDSQKQLELSLQDKNQLRQDLADLADYKKTAEDRISEFSKLTSKFKKLIDAGRLEVKIIEGRMVVVMSTDILFKSASSKLSAEGKREIELVAIVLKNLENKEFQIAGHTDNIPMRSKTKTNWLLAADRAYSVLRTMVSVGFPEERVSIASYGETKPVVENISKQDRAQNRRIEIMVVPDLSLLPGNEELEKL